MLNPKYDTNMKKSYIKPAVKTAYAMTEQMLALSLKPGTPADPNQPVGAPAKGSWDIFGADDEE